MMFSNIFHINVLPDKEEILSSAFLERIFKPGILEIYVATIMSRIGIIGKMNL